MTMLRKFNFWPPAPLKSHPWGITQATEWKSSLICFISFICEMTHRVWLKNLWNWLCNWNLIIFDLLVPPKGLRGQGPFMWVTHTPNCVEFQKNWIVDPFNPPPPPPPPPPSLTHQIWFNLCFVSFICEKTRKVWFKNIWNLFCNWNLKIFDLLTPFQGPRGWGQKNCAVAHPIHVSNSHTKFGRISSKGSEGDSV